ncbi:sensor histidine kinase [Parapedobacter sp. 10938]|uniref:sensor histidine kinase n=1 Tax=Parapedobacter flavus TaxID=3110225 RepID=UPI002DBEC73B|nr:histidine kinase [Parapedobacter sp. 10938]MEC3878789.1 histidine kinase [Parapedobacter sp. 10938]
MMSRFDPIIPDLLLERPYRIWRHLLIQVMVMLITINVFWDEPTQLLPHRLGAWVPYFLLIDTIIYVNMYLLVPRLLIKGRATRYIVLTALFIFLVVLTLGMLQDGAEGGGGAPAGIATPPLIGISSGFFAFALFIMGLTTLQLLKYRMENARRINELEQVTMEIELANLQNQINPHFLFNTLNNANMMAEEDGEKSAYMLSKLNDLLSYQVEGGAKDTVRLDDEIAFLDDYLELEKTRRDRFLYTIRMDGDSAVEIPPLLFIPFVENAVKHHPGNDSRVDIHFRVADGQLHFECRNPKPRRALEKEVGGIGLQNSKRRLELLFGRHFRLDLDDGQDTYTVKLTFGL